MRTSRVPLPLLLTLLCSAHLALMGVSSCESGDADADGWTTEDGDCNDDDASIHPGATEICDGIDQDCDGELDEEVTTTYYQDADGDDYGQSDLTEAACSAPDGYADAAGDCDDADPSIHPAAIELCDDLDNDCDGESDEGLELFSWYEDDDGDGYGTGTPVSDCEAPDGFSDQDGDCEDDDGGINPGASEICDTLDNNCDASIDEGVTSTFYFDEDGDGYGVADKILEACEAEAGWVAQSGDCNDADGGIHPGVSEICDYIDNNCDASIDEGVLLTFYLDQDDDGYGDSDSLVEECTAPAGYQASGGDCDDSSSARYPGAPELCNFLDDDCDDTVDNGADMIQIAAGEYHSIGLCSDGSVWTWGRNNYGQIGDGTTTNRSTPVQVSGIDGVVEVSAGSAFSMVLKEDGSVWLWGENGAGQIGTGSAGGYVTIPSQAPITDAVAITAGGYHVMVMKSDGTVWGWGANANGQLGDGTTTNRTSPVNVSSVTGAMQISAGGYHSLALMSDGTVRSWGYNLYGQLGDGTTTNRSTPVTVSSVSSATQVAASWVHSLVLKSDGTAVAFGRNQYGQLGDGTATNRSTAVAVSGLTGALHLGQDKGYTSVAITANGDVYSWGYNNYGQLGNGTTTTTYVPTKSSITDVAAVAGGTSHMLYLTDDGTVWASGYNGYGQLGTGSTTNSSLPVQVTGLP